MLNTNLKTMPLVDEGAGVFIFSFCELLVEHCCLVISIPWHFQATSEKVECSCQKRLAGTEKQHASILEMVPVITEMVKPRGQSEAEIVCNMSIIFL